MTESHDDDTKTTAEDLERLEEVESERRERLDSDHRPDNAEVDNTDRDFDAERGYFTDSEGYEAAEPQFAPEGEQGA